MPASLFRRGGGWWLELDVGFQVSSRKPDAKERGIFPDADGLGWDDEGAS